VDIRSGWSIAGLDVREYPSDDQPLAQAYVKDRLRRGVLEGCSKAEYDEVNTIDTDYLARTGVKSNDQGAPLSGYQEAHIISAANQDRLKLEASRGLGSHGVQYKDDSVGEAHEADEAPEDEVVEDDADTSEEGATEDDESEATAEEAAPAPAKKAPAKKAAPKKAAAK